MTQPSHRNEQTGDTGLDRIQANVRDLIAYVRGLAWLSARAYVASAVDTTIATAVAYATLLETTIRTDREKSFLLVSFTASGVHLTAQGTTLFRVLVDGTVAKGAWTTVAAGFAFTAAVVVRVPVTRGQHTVAVDWRTDANSARINAASVTEEHAALTAYEEAA